jgi:hypothetical protein
LGSVSYPGQADTNIYFAGNNTVADSEEGALVSAISMAEYAFHVKNPITGFNPLAWFIHHTYRNVMFPGFTAKKLMNFLRKVFYAEVALDPTCDPGYILAGKVYRAIYATNRDWHAAGIDPLVWHQPDPHLTG